MKMVCVQYFFDMNGQARRVRIKDENVQSSKRAKPKADKSNPTHIGAQMPGTVLQVDVSEGDEVEANQSLIITEAMKMETTVQAPFKGIVKKIHVFPNDGIETGDLLIEVEQAE